MFICCHSLELLPFASSIIFIKYFVFALRSSLVTLFLRSVKIRWSVLFLDFNDFLSAWSRFLAINQISLLNHGREYFLGFLIQVFVYLFITSFSLVTNLDALKFKSVSAVILFQLIWFNSFSKEFLFALGIPVVSILFSALL